MIATFSNHGTSAVHLAAPGVDILSAAPGVLERRRFRRTSRAPWRSSTPAGATACRTRTRGTGRARPAPSGAFSITDSPVGLSRQPGHVDLEARPVQPRRPNRLPDQLQHAARHGQQPWRQRRPTTSSGSSSTARPSAAGPARPSATGSPSATISPSPTAWPASRSGSGMDVDGDDAVVRRRLHRRPRRRLPAPQRQRVPVPRRHLDGDAARRRRCGAAAGGQPVPDGRAAQERHPRGRRHAGRPRDAHRRAAAASTRRRRSASSPTTRSRTRRSRPGPRNPTTARIATFRFTSSQAGSKFECKHMAGPWTTMHVSAHLPEPRLRPAYVPRPCDRPVREHRRDAGRAHVAHQPAVTTFQRPPRALQSRAR